MLEEDAGEDAGGEEGGLADEVEALVGEEGVGVGSIEGVEEEDFGEEGEQDAGIQDDQSALGEES